jgi:hypothetical protein
VNLQLAPISPEARRGDSEFWSAFDEARPQIFGALLDAVVWGLRELPRVGLNETSRMADFELFGHAAEGAYAAIEQGQPQARQALRACCLSSPPLAATS